MDQNQSIRPRHQSKPLQHIPDCIWHLHITVERVPEKGEKKGETIVCFLFALSPFPVLRYPSRQISLAAFASWSAREILRLELPWSIRFI